MEVPGKTDDGARAALAGAAGIGLAAALALYLLVPELNQPVTFDGVHVFLPMARRLVEEGPRYFQDPDSVRMGPVAYGYPALFGGREAAVRWANLVSFAAAVMLLGAAAWKAHSIRAGVATAYLVAASPLLRRWVPDVMTEPPFIFLTALWLFSVGRLAAGGSRWWIALAGLAFALASLTRPAASLFAPVVCAWFALRAIYGRAGERRSDVHIAVAHLVATLVWGSWLLHNAVSFGFPAIAGGAGNALWLGINPLTGGWDPLYFGLDYDDGAITGGLNPLSIGGDHLLGAAARLELADTSLVQLLELVARKMVAFVFVPPVEVFAWRGWRLVFLTFSVATLWWNWRSRLVQLAAAFALYMLAVHMPVLFTVRYSIGALDVPLALLAGIGVAECSTFRRARIMIPALMVVFALGWFSFGPRLPQAPRLEHAYVEPRWHATGAELSTRLTNAEWVSPGVMRLAKGAVIEIDVRDAPRLDKFEVTLATLDMTLAPTANGACSVMRLRYRAKSDAGYASWRKIGVPVVSDAAMHRYVVGTSVPLHVAEEGVLRMDFDCTAETVLTLGAIEVFGQTRGAIYRARLIPRS